MFRLRLENTSLGWDDLFNGLALICLLATVAIPGSTDSTTTEYWTSTLASNMLLWSTLWLVKASFLAFCWTIFQVSTSFRRAWWAVTIFTFLAFFPVFLGTLWQCGNLSAYADPATCNNFETTKLDILGGALGFAFHTSSELCILALPLVYIRQLQMSRTAKLSAASVFCIVIIDIIMGAMRNATDACFSDACNGITNTMMVLEPALAVFVCALPPYKILLSKVWKRANHPAAAQQDVEGRNAAPPPRDRPMRVAQVLDSIDEPERV